MVDPGNYTTRGDINRIRVCPRRVVAEPGRPSARSPPPCYRWAFDVGEHRSRRRPWSMGEPPQGPFPRRLSPSADAAATAPGLELVDEQSFSQALTVATPTAVATLFTVPYASGLGASTAEVARRSHRSYARSDHPGVASPSSPIYEITVSQVEGGWYVSSVKVENRVGWR